MYLLYMRKIIVLFLVLLIISMLCCYTYLSVYKIDIKSSALKKNIDADLLNEVNFNLDKMNLNRWNYGRPDFAPNINGSYKQVTNNYVPGFKFNNDSKDIDANKKNTNHLNNIKINAWQHKNNDKSFLVQCK